MRGARYLRFEQTTPVGRGFAGDDFRRMSDGPRACDVSVVRAAIVGAMKPEVIPVDEPQAGIEGAQVDTAQQAEELQRA